MLLAKAAPPPPGAQPRALHRPAASALWSSASAGVATHPPGACLLPRRLVDAFGSTRRKRQLQARDEGTVHAHRLVNSSAIQTALDGVNASATAAGLTRDEVRQRSPRGSKHAGCVHCCQQPASLCASPPSLPAPAAGCCSAIQRRFIWSGCAQVLVKAGTQRNIPEHHPTATLPHQAYVMKEMFSGGILEAARPGLLLKAADESAVLDDVRSKHKVGRKPRLLCRYTL